MDDRACSICFESTPPPYPTGCACRSDSSPALRHVECAFKEIVARTTQAPPDSNTISSLRSCSTCKQDFTGPFALLLARTVLDASGSCSGPYSTRVAALISLSAELLHSGSFAECERTLREAQRLGGDCMSIDSQLALCMTKTGRLVEAEQIQRASLARARAMYGESDIITTSHAHNLAGTLALLGRNAEAVDLLRLVYTTEQEQLGPMHHATLKTGSMLGHVLLSTHAYAEAVAVLRVVHSRMLRVFGANGPTLVVASNLATALFYTDALLEAEQIQRDVVGDLARLSPLTVEGLSPTCARLSLALTLCAQFRSSDAMALIREQYPTGSDFGEFTELVRCMRDAALPVGTAVTVHGLCSQAHLNGASAVVTGFDPHTFRYRLRLADGRRIGVRFECAAPSPVGDRARIASNLLASGLEGVTETSIAATIDHWYSSGQSMARFVREYPAAAIPFRDSAGTIQQMIPFLVGVPSECGRQG
jgi:hypothetical protein